MPIFNVRLFSSGPRLHSCPNCHGDIRTGPDIFRSPHPRQKISRGHGNFSRSPTTKLYVKGQRARVCSLAHYPGITQASRSPRFVDVILGIRSSRGIFVQSCQRSRETKERRSSGSGGGKHGKRARREPNFR